MNTNRKFIPLVLLISFLSLTICSASHFVDPTSISRITSTPTITPSPSPTPLPDGWIEHSVVDFHIAVPERWTAVDIEKENIETVLNLLEKFITPWANYVTRMLSSPESHDMYKFWAMESIPSGSSYATVNVMTQSMPFTIQSTDLCADPSSAYQQMGITLIDSQCGIKVNGFDSAWFKIQ